MKWRLNENSKIIVPGSVTDNWFLFNGKSFEQVTPTVNGDNLEFTVSKNKAIISLIRTNFDVLNPADTEQKIKAERIRDSLKMSHNINAHRVNEDDSSLGVIEHYDARGGKQVVSDYSGVHIYVPKNNDEIGMYFDGVDDYIDCENDASLYQTPNNQWCIEAWIYPTRLTDKNDIIRKSNGPDGYFLRIEDGQLKSFLHFDDDTYNSCLQGNIELNRWQHVVLTYDGTTRRHFINGEQVGEWIENKTLSFSDSGIVTVGRNSNIASEYFKGIIALVRIYNIAPTPERVKQLYQGSIITDGLVLYHDYTKKLTLSDGKIPDLSGNGNHGTINGAKWVNYAELEKVGIG